MTAPFLHMHPIWDAGDRTTRRRVLLALLLTSWALGLLLLDAKSFWLDEANGLKVVRLGLPALWAGQTELYHPPLFHWLLQGWLAGGTGEFYLRFPAVCCSTLSVLAAYRLAAAWFGRAVALTAALLMALSPLLVWYAQELRPYALLVLLGLVTTACVTRLAVQHPVQHPAQHPARLPVGWWLAAAASITAALYLHYFAVLLLGVHGLTFLALRAARRTGWWTSLRLLTVWGAAVVAWWPWLQSPAFQAFLRLPTDTGNYIAVLLIQRLGLPPALIQATHLWLVAGLVGGLAILPPLYWLLRAMHGRGGWARLQRSRWLPPLAVVVFVLFLAYSVAPLAYTVKRQTLLLIPYLLIAFAWCWPWGQQRRLLTAIAVLSLVLALVNVTLVPKNQWREAAAYVAAHAQPGDLVLLTPLYMTVPYDLYASPALPGAGVPSDFAEAEAAALLAGRRRIWLIEDPFDTDPQRRLARWLGEQAVAVDTTSFWRLDVQLYTLAAP